MTLWHYKPIIVSMVKTRNGINVRDTLNRFRKIINLGKKNEVFVSIGFDKKGVWISQEKRGYRLNGPVERQVLKQDDSFEALIYPYGNSSPRTQAQVFKGRKNPEEFAETLSLVKDEIKTALSNSSRWKPSQVDALVTLIDGFIKEHAPHTLPVIAIPQC